MPSQHLYLDISSMSNLPGPKEMPDPPAPFPNLLLLFSQSQEMKPFHVIISVTSFSYIPYTKSINKSLNSTSKTELTTVHSPIMSSLPTITNSPMLLIQPPHWFSTQTLANTPSILHLAAKGIIFNEILDNSICCLKLFNSFLIALKRVQSL